MTKGEQAEALFLQGYGCGQAVAGAFAQEMGLPQETVFQLASGFGGGMGRLREVCGTVSGMSLVLSAAAGYADPADNATKTKLYALIQEGAAKFRVENGSIICKELLGLAKPEGSPVPQTRTEAYYKKRPCAQLCAIAADITAELLAESASSSC